MKKLKVVFVDDEEMLCEIIPFFFKEDYFEIITYTSPELALAECLKNPPDVLFTDFNMPKMNGEELAFKLPGGFPIYLISGHIYKENELNYKFEKYLPSP